MSHFSNPSNPAQSPLHKYPQKSKSLPCGVLFCTSGKKCQSLCRFLLLKMLIFTFEWLRNCKLWGRGASPAWGQPESAQEPISKQTHRFNAFENKLYYWGSIKYATCLTCKPNLEQSFSYTLHPYLKAIFGFAGSEVANFTIAPTIPAHISLYFLWHTGKSSIRSCRRQFFWKVKKGHLAVLIHVKHSVNVGV